MPTSNTTIAHVITRVRDALIEPKPKFWGDEELLEHAAAGIRDLWRDIVDLKQEHFLTVDNTNVSYTSGSTTLTGVPADVHKVYIIEPRDLSDTSANTGIRFTPLPYNDHKFQAARASSTMDATNGTIYYSISSAGTPVGAPVIYCAPKVNATILISFAYVPSLGILKTSSYIPIPGEASNAIVAWTLAFARAKERDDRSPDPNQLAIYATEKQHLLQSLGLRQYQEPSYVQAQFEEYWG